MTIEFTATNGQGISFPDLTIVKDMDVKSVLSWVYLDAIVTNQIYGSALYIVSGRPSSWVFVYNYPSAGYLYYGEVFTLSTAEWRSTNQVISAGAWLFTSVTYDRTNVSNNPTFYLNGAGIDITEITAPSGSASTGTTNSFLLGDPKSTTPEYYSIDGKMASCLVYNRILSAQEILDAYNSRLAIPTYRGLVFAPNLAGAAGGVGDGSELAAANTITDVISGTRGVPAGSPILRADTVLTYE